MRKHGGGGVNAMRRNDRHTPPYAPLASLGSAPPP